LYCCAGDDDPRPFKYFWPGTEGMSSVAITSYNRAYLDHYHAYSLPFAQGFAGPYKQVAALTDLPIWIAETGEASIVWQWCCVVCQCHLCR
jgi:hypothetical protein